MKDDVRQYIYTTLIVFLIGITLWIGFLYVNACGFTLTCKRGALPVYRTPIPTLIPATLPAMPNSNGKVIKSDQCRVAAVDLIGAWVDAGSSETKAFEFTDSNGQNCEATFKDIEPLFLEANYWYAGSTSCVSCHTADLTIAAAQLDLSSYKEIMAGSHRADANSKGTDILGNGNWKSSLLYQYLTSSKADVQGHTHDLSSLMVFAGKPKPHPASTTTPQPAPTVTATP